MDADLEKQLLETTSEIWLVTGVAGFIGSHIAETLLNCGQTVYGVDNFSTGKQQNIDLLNNISKDKFKFFETDINNREAITSLVSKCSYVIHQAALGSVPRSVEIPVNSHNSNVNGFLNLLDIVKSHKNIKRVVYASSSSVYGDSSKLPKKEGEEGHVLSPYAATKRINEIYADAFSKSYGISIIGLRYFNVFGPRQDPNGPYAAVIPRWVSAIKKNETATIYGDGETSRDFCYISNVVYANIKAALSENLKNQSYYINIGCNENTTLNQLFDIIAESIVGEGSEKIKPKKEDFRVGDVRASLADISLSKSLINYEPKVFLREGIFKTVASS